jgi:hypothetical protein
VTDVIDLPVRDIKGGFSTDCRADRHTTCAMAGMRCTCPCHGTGGQQPRTPTPPAPTPIPRPLAAVPDPEPEEATVADNPTLPCDDCDRTFSTPQALGRHRTAVHGATAKRRTGQTPPQSTATSRSSSTVAEPVTVVGPLESLAVLATTYHELNGADVATCIESAGALLDAIHAAGWDIRPA